MEPSLLASGAGVRGGRSAHGFRALQRERVCRKSGELRVGHVGAPGAFWGQLCRRQLMSGFKVLDSSRAWGCNLEAVWD